MNTFAKHIALGCMLGMSLLQGCAKAPDSSNTVAVQQPTVVAPVAPTPVADSSVTAVAAGDVELAAAMPAATAETAPAAAPPASESPDTQSAVAVAPHAALSPDELAAHQGEVDQLCAQIGDKLGSVDTKDCLDQLFRFGGGYSVHGRPLMYKELPPTVVSSSSSTDKPDRPFRVLLMGGVHGDEYSSISIVFKWLTLFSPTALEGEFHWRFAPLVNPDGLLDGGQAVRQNANGVDLNRNFPSEDWNDTAVAYWQESTGSNPRRFPGSAAASEPEVQWIVQQMIDFQPDVIVSVHAPYHLLDFDGPAEAPRNIGELYLHQLGVYPGSLGNYAGLNKSIPVVTLELPSAGIMPKPDQIALMWKDLVSWLDREGRKKIPN